MSLFNQTFPRFAAGLNTLYRTAHLYTANPSVRSVGALISHAGKKALGRNVPPFITIAPTYRCVCRCVHCGVNSPERPREEELSTEEIKSIINQARDLGVLQVTFTGGEPLLRKDIFELIRHAGSLGLLTRINTSGILIDRNTAEKLKKSGLTQGAVSIDDADPRIHDELRGVPGAHDRAVRGIQNLIQEGILCQINTYADRRTVPEGLKRIISLGRNLNVLAVYFIFPTAIGHWEQDFSKILTDEEKKAVRNLQETTFVHLELPTAKTLCGILKKMILFISPQGNVTPCPFVSYSFGSIKSHPLKDFWRLHCRLLEVECRGECPMNIQALREAIKEHVENVAEKLQLEAEAER